MKNIKTVTDIKNLSNPEIRQLADQVGADRSGGRKDTETHIAQKIFKII